ncbi:hypothetical protein [Pontibacter mangrovi]|nr:hypothetical protein [Pontibacter mangrovi]
MLKLTFSDVITVCLLLYIYVLGGALQFFVNLSFTVSTALTIVLVLGLYFAHAIINKRLLYNKFIGFGLLLASIIILSSLLNHTFFVKTALYLSFVIFPIGAYIATRYFVRTKILHILFNKFFILLGLLQLPVLLIQEFGYDLLIKFKRTSQQVAPIDFNFGTFFLKNDHGLAFFLICLLLYLWLDPKAEHIKYKKIYSLVYVLSILLTNSTISHLLLAVTLLYLAYNKVKPRELLVYLSLALGLISVVAGLVLFMNSNKLQASLTTFINNAHYDRALKMYEAGVATRIQTLVVFINNKVEWLGHGPYSYFDILSGIFYQNPNFSQWIWFYFDLGIVGVVAFILFLLNFDVRGNLNKKRYGSIILGMLFIYAIFSTVTVDLTFTFTFFLFCRREQQPYEYNNTSIS